MDIFRACCKGRGLIDLKCDYCFFRFSKWFFQFHVFHFYHSWMLIERISVGESQWMGGLTSWYGCRSFANQASTSTTQTTTSGSTCSLTSSESLCFRCALSAQVGGPHINTLETQQPIPLCGFAKSRYG